MTHYTNYAIEIQDTEDAAAEVIGSISATTTPFDNDIQQSETAGRFYPEHVSVAGITPRSTFTTFDLKKMIDYLGLTGVNIEEDTGPPAKNGYSIYQAQYNNGELQPGTNHRRLRFPKSYAMNRVINVSHRTDAAIDCESLAIWDGSAQDPVLVEKDQALPTLPTSPGRWTLGPTWIGGVQIDCITDMTIDFGVNPSLFGCDSDIFDSKMNLDSIQPTVTITCLDVTGFTAKTPAPEAKVVLEGLCAQHVDTYIHLRKRATCPTGVGFVPDATPEHIRLTANGILNPTDVHSATGNQRAQISYQLTCNVDSAGNAPFIFDTASIIGVPV